MKLYEFGNPTASVVLVQPVDDHDLAVIENEIRIIKELTDQEFRLIAVKVGNWNDDLSPWKAPAVFGNVGFGGGAATMLKDLLKLCTDEDKTYSIGGYSLAGLFAIWVAYQTDVFSGVAAASPSVWFPGFTEYMKTNQIQCNAVYLSLGDRESRTKNQIMAAVGDRIKDGYDILKCSGIHTVLEWNEGNHFKDADVRTAKAFAWIINEAATGVEQ